MQLGTVDPIQLSKLIAALESEISKLGVTVRYDTSFERLEQLLPIDDKKELTPHFSTVLNTYSEANAFWVGGFDADENLVALNAVRMDDLGEGSMADWLPRYWHRCYPGKKSENAKASAVQPRFWRRMRGRIVYFGEFALQKKGFQGKGLPKLFGPFMLLLAAQKFSADWYMTWVKPRDWSMRYPLAYGFTTTYENGLRWDDPPASIDPDLVAAVNDRVQLLDVIDVLAAKYLEA
ncbi:hypothetical protein FIU93_21305 [Labrenzia sp. THAF35]|uniref:hypothetical protein n=1 Tax=Labrenzia sp. THAF35 TaxID=2587854 RepID=UPI0012689AD5|nr:hypothetical protein [Labrenzia sp. THAF35]QFT69338.1 hypothetical protein FIU93_21305 [Labrenzia sp. THAF35]